MEVTPLLAALLQHLEEPALLPAERLRAEAVVVDVLVPATQQLMVRVPTGTRIDAVVTALLEEPGADVALAGWAESLGLRLTGLLRERRRTAYQELLDQSGGQAAVDRAGGPASGDEVDRFTAVEVAAAMRVSQACARERVGLADDVLRRQPATVQAMSAGLVGLAHADDWVAHCLCSQRPPQPQPDAGGGAEALCARGRDRHTRQPAPPELWPLLP